MNIHFVADTLDQIVVYANQKNICNIKISLLNNNETLTSTSNIDKLQKVVIDQPIQIDLTEQQNDDLSEQPNTHINLDDNNAPKENTAHNISTNIEALNCEYKFILFRDLILEDIIKAWIKKLGTLTEIQFENIKVITYGKFNSILSRKFLTKGRVSDKTGMFAVIEVVNNQVISQYYNGFNQTTNIRMDLIAILEVLESTKLDEHILIGTYTFSIIESFTTNLLNYIGSQNLLNSGIKNLDLICRVLYYLKNRYVSFCHLKRYSNEKLGDHIDALTYLKRDGNEDFSYLRSLEQKPTEHIISYIQPYQINIQQLFAKNKVFSQNYYKQTEYWVQKLTIAQKTSFLQFQAHKIPKFYSFSESIGDNGGICIVNYDKQSFLPVKFHAISKIRTQLYGLLLILLITELEQSIAIITEDLFIQEILITQRDLWTPSMPGNQYDMDLLAQIFYYTLDKQIFITQRVELGIKCDARQMLQQEKQCFHDFAFETLVEQANQIKKNSIKQSKAQPAKKPQTLEGQQRVMRISK